MMMKASVRVEPHLAVYIVSIAIWKSWRPCHNTYCDTQDLLNLRMHLKQKYKSLIHIASRDSSVYEQDKCWSNIDMMKLTSILILTSLIAAGGESQQDLPGSRRLDINVTNDIASPNYGNDLATLQREVAWEPSDEGQEKCAHGEAKTTGEKGSAGRTARRSLTIFPA